MNISFKKVIIHKTIPNNPEEWWNLYGSALEESKKLKADCTYPYLYPHDNEMSAMIATDEHAQKLLKLEKEKEDMIFEEKATKEEKEKDIKKLKYDYYIEAKKAEAYKN